MSFKRRLLTTCFALVVSFAGPLLATAQTRTDNRPEANVSDHGWPRKIASGRSAFAIYQPQVEEWVGNKFSARAAFSVADGPDKQPSYGVLWFNARTQIDKVNRLVTLSD